MDRQRRLHIARIATSRADKFDTQRVFSHWAWVVAALLLAAALTLYQADAFPPTVDEFATLYSSGWMGSVAEPPAGLVQSLIPMNLAENPASIGVLPGYGLLLGVWGVLVAKTIATARVFGVLLYLLSLSLVYRLSRDLIAPIAGLFALVIVMSNTFFNFYLAHARNYTLFFMLSCLTIWLYLRITQLEREPTVWNILSLGAAVFGLVMTHLFSATLLFTLGLYHLFFVPKNRRWLAVGLAISLAVLLCLPLISQVLTRFDTAYSHLDGPPLGTADAVATWLMLMLNNQPAPLLLVSAAGLVIGRRQGLIGRPSWLMLPALFVVTIGLLGAFTTLLRAQAMRHQLDGWVLLVLFAAAGHYALFRWKRWLVVLPVVWILAGLAFQPDTIWWNYIGFRSAVFLQPPYQAISRLAKNAEIKPNLVGYPYDGFLSYALSHRGHAGARYDITPGEHYFSQYGVEISATDDRDEYARLVGELALRSPSIWLFHNDHAEMEDQVVAEDVMRRHDYRRCGEIQVGSDTIVKQYSWGLLACQALAGPAVSQTELINYEYYSAGLSADAKSLYVIGRWLARKDFSALDYGLSYQLLSEDWRNVAQLDLPLVAENELRHLAIDVSGVTPGQYRLMLILYNMASGERLSWDGNQGNVPEMLQLGEFTFGDP